MNLRRMAAVLTASVSVGLLSIGQAHAEDPGPSSDTSAASEEVISLWLDGPFGTVQAGSPLAPVPGPGAPVLDTWAQDVPIGVLIRPDTVLIEAWEVVSGRGDRTTGIASGAAYDPRKAAVGFPGPSTAGDDLVTAKFVTTDGVEVVGAWQLRVPDRPFPEDGVMDIPAPDLTLTIGDETITGLRGDGCYIYLCVTIGRLPPLSDIEAIVATPGEQLRLSLTDGTGFRIQEATFVRLDGDTAAIAVEPEQVDQAVVELAAPPRGAWLLSLEVVFDRERGLVETVFRLLQADAAA